MYDLLKHYLHSFGERIGRSSPLLARLATLSNLWILWCPTGRLKYDMASSESSALIKAIQIETHNLSKPNTLSVDLVHQAALANSTGDKEHKSRK